MEGIECHKHTSASTKTSKYPKKRKERTSGPTRIYNSEQGTFCLGYTDTKCVKRATAKYRTRRVDPVKSFVRSVLWTTAEHQIKSNSREAVCLAGS